MQHTDSLWRVFSVVYFSQRNSPVCVMGMWESETTKASSDTVFKGQGQLMVLVCGRWFYHPHGCFFNDFVLCILPLRLRRRETCLFDHLALCPIFLPCSCLPILIVIFKNKDASSKIRKQYRRLRSNMCLSILFARRKYVVLLSRYRHKPRHCLSPFWSHVHTVPSELKETHCLHTCHPNIIAAALWEASLTFSGLPVNDASSSPVSNEARNAVKRQARLSAPYLLVESYCGGNWWVTWPKGEHQLQSRG